MADLPTNSAAKIRYLRALPYREYLKTPWWRLRRHARLKTARGKCERCAVVTSIADVHHVHYDRLGAERDTDLEVLCRNCHDKHHFEESRKQHLGVYIMLARETQRLDKPAPEAFEDAFRTRCDALKLVTHDHRFDNAVTLVLREQPVSIARVPRRVVIATPDPRPIGKQEAINLCAEMGLRFPVKVMPTTYGMGAGVAATRARAAARLKAQRCPQCQGKGAQLSGVQIGFLWCESCHHRWPLTAGDLS